MVGMPSSCALLGGFAISAWVLLLWEHTHVTIWPYTLQMHIAPNAKCQQMLVLALCLVVLVKSQWKDVHDWGNWGSKELTYNVHVFDCSVTTVWGRGYHHIVITLCELFVVSFLVLRNMATLRHWLSSALLICTTKDVSTILQCDNDVSVLYTDDM